MSRETVLERVWSEKSADAKSSRAAGFQPTSSSPTAMSFTSSRATSPSLLPFRFSSQADGSQSSKKQRESKSPDFISARIRRSSTQSYPKPSEKRRDPTKGKDSVDSSTSPESTSGFDPFAARYNASTSFTSYETSRPSTAEGSSSLKRSRGSLLVAASDALGFKFGRRRKSIRQPPMPIILPDVIEISAPRRDEEVEERERLRDAAARAIGLGPLLQDTLSRDEGLEDEDEDLVIVEENQGVDEVRPLDPPTGGRSPYGSSLSVSLNGPPLIGRHRAGSLLVHTRTNSTTPASVPSFPSTPSALQQFMQDSSTIPKYYPPSSLRIFALSKHWKNRHMVLSSPTSLMTRGTAPTVSYLHLFKSSGADEKELERLEINEDSIVFVAEEEVGGRRHVVKVGGVDVGALKKELNHEEGGRTMWFLQLTNAAEAQRWIAAIKNAILGQRTVRAGLPLPAQTLGGNEPRGDMDVMLYMRTQGIVTSPLQSDLNVPDLSNSTPRVINSTTPVTSPPTSSALDQKNYASSISSQSVRSQATTPKTVPTSAVSTLKGLFAGTRPRSSSRATSIEQDRQDREMNDDSFGSMGSNLLSMFKSNTTDVPPASFSAAPRPVAPRSTLPFSGPIGTTEQRLDRRIIVEHQPGHWIPNDAPLPVTKDRANRTLSLGALSLQPPPRKRWTSVGTSGSTTEEIGIYKQVNGNTSMTGSFGIGSSQPPASPTLSGFSFGTPEQKPRAPSIQSVSTFASGGSNVGLDRSNSSTKRSSSTKRWSRQGTLPKLMTPPSGPPPSVPHSQSSSSSRLQSHHPYAGERSPSRSSTHSGTSQQSVVSGLPNFSKRASASSALSINTASTSHSHTNGLTVSRPTSSHRSSMPPPPRPAPTFALPPAPDQEPKPESPSATKSSFRDSVAHRAFRLSLIAPKPPPSTVLPPRPDDPEYRTHCRVSSAGSTSQSAELYSIPASPTPSVLADPPFPPPRGPLPPTPASAPASRHASIKQRLRRLSTPSPSASMTNHSPLGSPRSRPSTMTIYSPTTVTTSPPATPIAEKITHFQNDPSFLQLYTPITPSLPAPKLRTLPPPPEQYPELTSLSPPPRRGSKQISILDKDTESSEVIFTPEDKRSIDGEPKMLSLSRHGSVISLGIVSM